MTAKEMVTRFSVIRPIPGACLKIVTRLERRELTNESVVELLKGDDELVGKVLRACNSSHYGFTGSITSLDQAVLVLGCELIVPIVIAASVRGALEAPMEVIGFEPKELWRHSLATAAVAETFALDGLVPDEDSTLAFAAGLLHDIGKAVIGHAVAPEQAAKVRLEVTKNRLSRIEAEKAVLGTDHAEVGARLLEEWGMPPKLVEAVANHHKPPVKPKPRLSALVCISDSVVHLAGSAPGWESYALKVDSGLAGALNLDAPKVERMLITARDSFSRVERFVDVA